MADDDVLLREGIASLLGEAGYDVIERASDARALDRIGYLLKSRIMKVGDLVDALERIALSGAVIDPVLVQELLIQQHRADPLAVLTGREREVLSLVAGGRTNSGIANPLWISEAPSKSTSAVSGRSLSCPPPTRTTAGCSRC